MFGPFMDRPEIDPCRSADGHGACLLSRRIAASTGLELLPDGRQNLVEFLSIQYLAADDHRVNATDIGNIVQRIGVKDDEIGSLARDKRCRTGARVPNTGRD